MSRRRKPAENAGSTPNPPETQIASNTYGDTSDLDSKNALPHGAPQRAPQGLDGLRACVEVAEQAYRDAIERAGGNLNADNVRAAHNCYRLACATLAPFEVGKSDKPADAQGNTDRIMEMLEAYAMTLVGPGGKGCPTPEQALSGLIKNADICHRVATLTHAKKLEAEHAANVAAYGPDAAREIGNARQRARKGIEPLPLRGRAHIPVDGTPPSWEQVR